jgi:hypothetical protein
MFYETSLNSQRCNSDSLTSFCVLKLKSTDTYTYDVNWKKFKQTIQCDVWSKERGMLAIRDGGPLRLIWKQTGKNRGDVKYGYTALTQWGRGPWRANSALSWSQSTPPLLYGTWRFITVFTRARHQSMSWGRWVQSTSSHLTSVLVLSSHLRLGLPSGFFHSGLIKS